MRSCVCVQSPNPHRVLLGEQPYRRAWAGVVLRGRAGRAACGLSAACCAMRQYRHCRVCSCWVVVAESRRGAIAVLLLLRARRARRSTLERPHSILASLNACTFVLQRLAVFSRYKILRAMRAMARSDLRVAHLAAVDYEALRVEARSLFASKIEEVRGSIVSMQKAQRAAEQALDMLCCNRVVHAVRLVCIPLARCRYERSCAPPAAA